MTMRKNHALHHTFGAGDSQMDCVPSEVQTCTSYVFSVTYTLLGKKVFMTEKDFVRSEVRAAAEETVQHRS